MKIVQPLWRWLGLYWVTVFALGFPSSAEAQTAPRSNLDEYNLVVGTQTIGAAYGFTGEDRLVETAKEIRKLGSNILKFSLPTGTVGDFTPANLTDVARHNPAVKQVLGMPFSHILMWAYPVASKGEPQDAANLDANYREIYDLTCYLLTTYKDTGKTFYLGNWEGDWHLLHTDPNTIPTEAQVQAMIDWVNMRQKAVDEAKRATPHKGVEVYHYLEVNRVQDAMQGKVRLANAVLPKTNVDFVSYSSYDSLNGDLKKNLMEALDYIESKLPAKAGIEGKRVWIGEYGFPTAQYSAAEQDERSRKVMSTALIWGCPFVLYWEMYNNEVVDGKQRGFWMIDDHNEKQLVYFTHARFLHEAKDWVANFLHRAGRLPTRVEFGNSTQMWP